MNLSRRTFLFALTAAGVRFCGAGVRPTGPARLRFGVLSDTHVTDDPKSAESLRRILRRFAQENVDAVVHAGDICHIGTTTEFAHVLAAWRGAFPDGKNAAGRPVVPFFAFGNHDYHAASFQCGKAMDAAERSVAIVANKDKVWRDLTGEPFPGEVFSKEIRGYTFVGAHWGHEGEIAEFFKAHPAPTDKPVFYVQHPHPMATCYGAWATGRSEGKDELLRHPNLWAMSGHSHLNIACDTGIWQGGFVSMGAGCASGASPGGFGGVPDNVNLKPNRWKSGQYKHSKIVKGGGSWQGEIVSVYPDQVVVDRYDFHNETPQGESLGAAWVAPFPFEHDAARPYRIADAAKAPQFAGNEKFVFKRTTGVRRPDKSEEKQLCVTVPAARSDGDWSRPYFYRFEVREAATGRKILDRLIISDFVAKSERHSCKRPVRCSFAESELPKGVPLVFAVEPQNAAARPGKPLVSDKYALN